MPFRSAALLLIVSSLPAMTADWNAEAAAAYLDSRQKEWFAWPTAKAQGGACMSCHTGMTYLMARPLLPGASTPYESGLRDGLRTRLAGGREATPKNGVEAVMAALLLPGEEAAFERLWSLQIADGPKAGSWPWFSLDLDPYEMPESAYFGASLAAMAVGQMPASYRARADVKPRVEAMLAYLHREASSQPLHNRLAVLWASTRLPEAMPLAQRAALLQSVWKSQQPDGGWTLEALGPWKSHATAPPQPSGSHNYATAYVAMVLTQAGAKDARLDKARAWLRQHQDRTTGSWPAPSMNKVYKDGSMMTRFVEDAKTGFAVMALSQASPQQ